MESTTVAGPPVTAPTVDSFKVSEENNHLLNYWQSTDSVLVLAGLYIYYCTFLSKHKRG